jgi:hypothetical protein
MKIEQYQYEQYNISQNNQHFEIDAEAKSLAYLSWLDVLNCDISWARQATEKTYDELIEIFKNSKFKLHAVLIMRKGMARDEPEYYFEVGISNMSLGVKYFTHHYITAKDGFKLIKKYKLVKK